MCWTAGSRSYEKPELHRTWWRYWDGMEHQHSQSQSAGISERVDLVWSAAICKTPEAGRDRQHPMPAQKVLHRVAPQPVIVASVHLSLCIQPSKHRAGASGWHASAVFKPQEATAAATLHRTCKAVKMRGAILRHLRSGGRTSVRMCLGLVRDAAEARDSPGTSIPLKLQVTHKAQRRTAALLWPFRICTGNRLSSSRGYDSQPTRGQDQFGRDPTRSDGEPMVHWQGLRVVTPPRCPTPRPPLPLSVLPSAQPAMSPSPPLLPLLLWVLLLPLTSLLLFFSVGFSTIVASGTVATTLRCSLLVLWDIGPGKRSLSHV